MPDNKSRLVLLCQQTFALAVVGAVAVSALGVVELQIVPPGGDAGARASQPAPGGSPGGSLVATAPVRPTVRSVALPRATVSSASTLGTQSGTAARRTQEFRVVSAVETVTGFGTVGVTWDGRQELAEDAVALEVRTRSGGAWTSWQDIAYEPEHGAAPTEGEQTSGSEPVVVGDVDAVQVRATSAGEPLRGLTLALVDPGEDAAPAPEEPALAGDETATGDQPAAASGDATLSAARASVAQPRIYSREQWGADERLRDAGSLQYGEIHAGFVHHTVNANDYSRGDVPAIIRGIYAYHTQSRGWSDVGYNFLVDRFGRIWEGRYGGVSKAVVGAHTLGYNSYSFAMSAIGNFETARPSAAVLRAYGDLMAWKLWLAGVDAADTRVRVGSGTFQAINGHRDAGSTACPGRYLYAELPRIRALAAERQREGGPATDPDPTPTPRPAVPTTTLNLQLSGAVWPDLVVRDRTTKRAMVVRTGGQAGFGAAAKAGRWPDADLLAFPGDLDGDGQGDVVVRDRRTRVATVHRGTASGGVGPALWSTRALRGVDRLTGAGDLDGDGHGDVVARSRAGRLVVMRGRGDGTLGPRRLLGGDWRRYDVIAGVDDLDRDGHRDLVVRRGATLSLVRGTGTSFRAPVALPGRWSRYGVVAGRGDATRDGVPDLVVRERGTRLTYIVPGDGRGGFALRVGGYAGFGALRHLQLARIAGTAPADLAGLSTADNLKVFEHNHRRNLGPTVDTGVRLDGVDLLLSVGDWNGDGRGDVMTRSSGTLHLRRGVAGGRLAAPVVVREDFAATRLAAVGDMTGDGFPDLIGTGGKGVDRIFPSNGRTGFAATSVLRDTAAGEAQVGLGFWDGDRTPDSGLVRGDGALWVWSTQEEAFRKVADGLDAYAWVRGPGDVDGDGRADLLVRSRAGRLFLLPGAVGGFGVRRAVGDGFERYDLVG